VRLSVIIVNYNSCDDLARCLASLRSHAPACEHAVVVVDNASREPGLAEVRQRHPEVRWVMNHENVGYARGVNRGLAEVEAEYALILNPDIEVLPGSLDALLALADQRPRAGIIGPQLLNPDRTVQASARRFYTFTTLLLRRTPLGRLFPNARSVREHLMLDFDFLSERAVDWVLGGAMLVRRRARERTGPLDERFFLYFEDVDWCYRMWQAGWEVLYTPAASLVHGHRRASAGGAFRRAFWLHMGSFISFYEKWGMLVYLLKRWGRLLSAVFLWLLDMIALDGALLLAFAVRKALNPLFPVALYPLGVYAPLFVLATLLGTVTFVMRGRYQRTHARQLATPTASPMLVGLIAVLLFATSYLSHERTFSRSMMLLFIPLFWMTLALVSVLFAALRKRMERDYLALERTLLVGPAATLSSWIAARGDLRRDGLDVVGYAADAAPGEPAPGPLKDGELPWLGGRADIEHVAARYRVAQVVFWDWPGQGEADLVRRLQRQRIRVRWHLDDDGSLGGARPEPFGHASSLVLEPRAAFNPARVIAHLTDRVSGLMLFVLAALPCLLARGVARAETADFVWRAAIEQEGPSLRLLTGRDGRPRALWVQAPLGLDLMLGRITLTAHGFDPDELSGIWNDLALAPEEFVRADRARKNGAQV
jgi:N-acetylglucosaminyl-diphospho-decaprenol L-rhamnosyltransferase